MIEKVSATATQAGAGVALASGVELVFGLTPGEWSVLGVIGGLLIGVAGYLTNLYYLRKRNDSR
jgi:hypothetical protein